MEYRALPHGAPTKRFSTLGLGLGGIQQAPAAEIRQVIETAIAHGINFFDLCAGAAKTYAPFGQAIRGRREQVFFQLHLGAVYNESGEYGWSRDLSEIQRTFAWELETLGTDYADFGFLHCLDEESDLAAYEKNGVLAYVQDLKAQGVIRHLGLSSHTPALANKVLDLGIVDVLMFSVNPVYDYGQGDSGIGSAAERHNLYCRCQREGVGITVMKPFSGGQLLDAAKSPFGRALTKAQCIQYALDKPGVVTVLPGFGDEKEMREVLQYFDTPAEERDYACLGEFAPPESAGRCVYCKHCHPCPAGLDIAQIGRAHV